jgi:hypothetical protein
MNFGKPLQLEKKLVDVTGFEPATPCLQSRSVENLNACSGVAYEHSDALLIRTMIPNETYLHGPLASENSRQPKSTPVLDPFRC